jgi:hypothetical protein
VSDPEEISGLREAGVVAIDLRYHETRRRDEHGNMLRYFSRTWVKWRGRMLPSRSVDVIFVVFRGAE